ncbi:hypothetical protein HPP92_017359 [Vanilla planifolia]|uniref:Uncharacterized protein n=1 Tax=Vanilla planifolia TaxID=51239 RepID=A0A835QDY2_VANPL|nr:hypothetical protein HPP92_017359 [Vanilla planifolia]
MWADGMTVEGGKGDDVPGWIRLGGGTGLGGGRGTDHLLAAKMNGDLDDVP